MPTKNQTISTINRITLTATDSTNTYAKSLRDCPRGDDCLTVIRALRQTGGRGRHDRSFFSDNEGGLWVSIVTPIADMSAHFYHNRAISLAIADSLKNVCDGASDIKIKWPNDVYVNGKKIAGILLENTPQNSNALIIGFGVNVNMGVSDFPSELRDRATSLLIETGRGHSIEKLLDEILEKYLLYGNDTKCHAQYVDYLYGKNRQAVINGHAGIFVAVDENGFLKLETENGIETFSSGTLLFEDGDDGQN